MNRLKVLVLALVAVGLWGAHLTMTSPAIAAKGVEQASAPLLLASGAVAQRLEQTRSELQGAALKLASSPAVLIKPGGKVEAPSVDRVNQVRIAVFEAMSEGMRANAYVIVSNDQGATMAQGSADPGGVPEGFDVKAAAAAGHDGVLLEMGTAPVLFFSVPVLSTNGAEVVTKGAVLVGAPLWGAFKSSDALAEAVAKDLNLSGLGLWMKGKLVAASGKKDALEKAFKAAKPNQTSPVEQGAATTLGPIGLPMFVGAANVLELAARRDVPGTPFEICAVVSVRPFMETLGASQKTALLMLIGLLLAGLVFTVLVSSGTGQEVEDEDSGPRAMSMPPRPQTKPPVEPVPASVATTQASSLAMNEPPPVPETTADDFNFPPPPPPAPPPMPTHTQQVMAPTMPFDEPAEDPFASAGPVVPPPLTKPPSSMSLADDDFENQRTTAYPAHKIPKMDSSTDSHAALDPFALAAAQSADGDSMGGVSPEAGFNPDATRVAAIPPELLKAAQQGGSSAGVTAQYPANKIPPPMAPKIQSIAPVGGASDEETHFQTTFRDFLATRQKCGEPNDGMTYDKFAAKLRKNKEQLVTKYNCKTVRFQVYVKDGKAALKATPVKD